MARKTIQPNDVKVLFETLADMPSTTYDSLASSIRDGLAFNAGVEDLDSIASNLRVRKSALTLLLSLTSYLYTGRNTVKRDGGAGQDFVIDFITSLLTSIRDIAPHSLSEEKRSLFLSRMSHLSESNPKSDHARKVQRARRGFVPSLSEVSTYVDLRPILDEDQQEVVDLLPIIQVRLEFDGYGDGIDHSVFQLDVGSLRQLKTAIERAEHKVSVIERLRSKI